MLPVKCPKCSYDNKEGARFCAKCGTPLAPQTRPQGAPPQAGAPHPPVQSPAAGNGGPQARNTGQPRQPQGGQTVPPVPPAQQTPQQPVGGSSAGPAEDIFGNIVDNFSQKAASGWENIKRRLADLTGMDRMELNKAYSLQVQQGTIRIQLLSTFQSSNSNVKYCYYQVRLLSCEKHESGVSYNGKCTVCGRMLKVLLMHEYYPNRLMSLDDRVYITNLSRNFPGALVQPYISSNGQSQRVLSEMPVGKFQLMGIEPMLISDLTNAKKWISHVGSMVQRLHQKGLVFYDPYMISDVLEPLALLNDNEILLTDLCSCQPYGHMPVDPRVDIQYLVRLFYTLVTGNRQMRSLDDIDYVNERKIPPQMKEVLKRAMSQGMLSVQAFLTELLGSAPAASGAGANPLATVRLEPQQPAPQSFSSPTTSLGNRSLRQMAGWRTDVGKARDHNEDFVSAYSIAMDQTTEAMQVGLYLVADGMGGHQSGEEASKAVTEVVIRQVQENLSALSSGARLNRATINLEEMLTPADILKTAIQKSNDVLLNAKRKVGSDRGTTITAALVVGSKAYIANVGDSRTYIMQQNKLTQVTRDHSLVDSLVRGGVIKPGEVRSHPQRNQIYRTMGDRPNVEVDIFTCDLNAGDRLLLCSDGLWEMVLDSEIERIMLQSPTPQKACDRLIQEANRNGGEDNISVVVVLVE